MCKYLLLFRGINVGGNNLIAMKALKECLTQAGFGNVQTYIQSGNVVLEADTDPRELVQSIIKQHFLLDIEMLVLTKTQFLKAIENHPFEDFDGKTVHFYFCHQLITLNNELVAQYKSKTEQVEVHDKVLYLHAPDGVGRSKLVANIERCLGQVGTGRNLNTIRKIKALLN